MINSINLISVERTSKSINVLNTDDSDIIAIIDENKYNILKEYLISVNAYNDVTVKHCLFLFNLLLSDTNKLNTNQIRVKYKIRNEYLIIGYLLDSGILKRKEIGNSISKRISIYTTSIDTSSRHIILYTNTPMELDLENNTNIRFNNCTDKDIKDNRLEISSLNKTKINIGLALNKLGEKLSIDGDINSYYNGINQLIKFYNNDKYFGYSEDRKSERVYHSINGMNKVLRTCLYITVDDEDVYLSEIDLNNSQLVMLLKTLTDLNLSVDSNFIKNVNKGIYYESIMNKVQEMFPTNTNITGISDNKMQYLDLSNRNHTKTATYKYLLFSKKITVNKYTKVFKELYPKTFQSILDLNKLINGTLASILQNKEASIFRHLNLNEFELTVHDAVLFPNINDYFTSLYNKLNNRLNKNGNLDVTINNNKTDKGVELNSNILPKKERKQHRPHKKHKSSAKSINRKQEIIDLKNKGYKNKEIAEMLNISLSTVKRAK